MLFCYCILTMHMVREQILCKSNSLNFVESCFIAYAWSNLYYKFESDEYYLDVSILYMPVDQACCVVLIFYSLRNVKTFSYNNWRLVILLQG